MTPLSKPQLVQIMSAIVVFGATAYAAEKGSDWFLSKNFDHKPSYISSGTLNADILIQGPSRAVHMMDPAVLNQQWSANVYNLAVNGSHVDEQLSLLRLYLKHNRAPRIIFFEHSALYLGKTPGKNRNAHFHSFMFVDAMRYLDIRADVKAHDPTLYWAWYVPSLKYALYNDKLINLVSRGAIQAVRGSREVNFVRGYQPLDRGWDGNFDVFKKEFPQGRRFELADDRIEGLQAYLRFAQSKGIPVVLYQAPILREALPFFVNHDELEAKTREIIGDTPWVTFYDLALNEDRTLFYNSTHLNRTGATQFSEIFAERMRRYVERVTGKPSPPSRPLP